MVFQTFWGVDFKLFGASISIDIPQHITHQVEHRNSCKEYLNVVYDAAMPLYLFK